MSMRRCAHCQAANPAPAQFCHGCGRPLPATVATPFFVARDWYSSAALNAALLPLAGLLVFRLSFGGWLFGSPPRDEARFLAFHMWYGLLLGLAVASTRREKQGGLWLAWAAVGLAGGVLAESLEIWFTFKHLVQGLTFSVADWFEVSGAVLLPYRLLQGLRLLGVLAPLMLFWIGRVRPRVAAALALVAWLLAGLALRAFVKGAFLNWPGLATVKGLENLVLYALSTVLILHAFGLGQRETLDAKA